MNARIVITLFVVSLSIFSANVSASIDDGLVGYWKFDDGTANDSSGYGNNGKLLGNAVIANDSQRGTVLLLDGNGDYVTINDNDRLDIVDNLTITAWVKCNGASPVNFPAIVQKGIRACHNYFLGTWLTGRELYFTNWYNGYGYDNVVSGMDIPQNAWCFVAVTVSGKTVNFFINDICVAKTKLTQPLETDNYALLIGRNIDQNSYFNGAIDDVRIYNRTLSSQEITELSAPIDNGLVAHWKLDGDALDSAGSNNGTIHGAVQTNGQVGSAMLFDGVNDYISFPQLAVTTTEFTISAWANHFGPAGGLTGESPIFSQRDDSGDVNHSAVILLTKLGTNYTVASATIRSSIGTHQRLEWPMQNYNQWHHYAMTVNSSFLIFYIDGLEVGRTINNQAGNYTTSVDYVDIGRYTYFGNKPYGFFNGAIDDVRVYNRALSSQEITELSASIDNGLVAHWKLDGNALDSAGSNNGTIHGAVQTNGQVGSAMLFDGVDDYISFLNPAVKTTQFSISVWANHYGTGGGKTNENVIFSQRDDAGGDNHCTVNLHSQAPLSSTTAAVAIRSSSGKAQVIYSPIKNYNQWHHYVTTVDTNYLIFYIDGIEVSRTSNNQMGVYNSSIDYINIGRQRYESIDYGFFNGAIDDVRVYNRALSAQEITELFKMPVNHTPVAAIDGTNRVVQAQDQNGALVTLDGSYSTDQDSTPGTNDDIVQFNWYERTINGNNQVLTLLAQGPSVDLQIPFGQHTIVLEVIDSKDLADMAQVTVTVEDSLAPEFNISVSPSILWPVNHKMIRIDPIIDVKDNCDSAPKVSLLSVTIQERGRKKVLKVNEPDQDVYISSEGQLYLRAECAGNSLYRIYILTYQAVDAAGNKTEKIVTVTVPHDSRSINKTNILLQKPVLKK